ncbi:hypothetical protein OHC33_003077 [Knufia fluminis]|uniref:Uncharacterized protein n=1 Tax=Knufia fluminis TaxID=191047 RepID=A0AAN8EGS4_9EURO|nr:hypothetical protein OHC33_003077 [Knufia fluminis]
MQLLVKTPSQTSNITAQASQGTRPPYSKAYQQQSHLLRELGLQHAKHKHFQQALTRKQTQLRVVASDESEVLSTRLLKRQVESLEYHTRKCEEDIATLRSQLNLEMVAVDDMDEEEQEEISSALWSATSEVMGFEIEWPVSAAFTPTVAYHDALDQEIAEELEKVSLEGAGDEDVKGYVPAKGWESVLGTWV